MALPRMDVRPASEFAAKYGESEFYTTTLFNSREEWLAGRKGHLGASAAFMVLDTELRDKLFREMRGEIEHEDLSENELVQRGVHAEEHVRALIAVENPDWDFYDGGNLLFVSKRKPFMSATLDCIAVHRDTGELADIELKECPWSSKWKGEFAPDSYFAQVMHQHYVTGISYCALHPRIYLRHEGQFTTSFERSYEWDMRDDDIQAQVKQLVAEEEAFWSDFKRGGKLTPKLALPSIF